MTDDDHRNLSVVAAALGVLTFVCALALGACNSPAQTTPTPLRAQLVLSDPTTQQLFTAWGGQPASRVNLPAYGTDPSWTDDGRIIYATMASQVEIINADGSGRQQIGTLPLHGVLRPQMHRGRITFGNSNGIDGAQWQGSFVMQANGMGLRQIARNCAPPTLSPDATWIACTVSTQSPYHREVWRFPVNGGTGRQLTTPGDPDYPDANAPSISADGGTIALFSGLESLQGPAGANQSIFTWGWRNVAVIPAQGGARRVVTHCHPVTTPAELSALGPLDCIDADSTSYALGANVIVYLRGNPKSAAGSGLWAIGPDGSNDHQLWQTGGGGAVPVRYIPPTGLMIE